MAAQRKRNDDSPSWYGKYNPDWGKRATAKYIAEKTKRVLIAWKKTTFEEYIGPAIKKSGKPLATFIKEAVNEKIKREKLGKLPEEG